MKTLNESTTDALGESSLLRETLTNAGISLAELSAEKPVLLVLLRHLGCTFCRNAMADIARRRHSIEQAGAVIAFGHMSTPGVFSAFAARYGLADVAAIADPERRLYQGLGLKRGTFMQLLGPRVWRRGAMAFFRGHIPGKIRGDGAQMPGVFLIHEGRIVRRFMHRDAADTPDYVELAALQD